MSDAPAAGWYAQGDGSQRYWDGAMWTEHVHRPAPPPPVPASALVAPPVAYGAAPMVVAAKSPGVALLASFFIPGLGTMMNGEAGKGALILIGYFVSVLLAFVLIGIPLMIGLWIWGMVDAYTGAQRWNAARGIHS